MKKLLSILFFISLGFNSKGQEVSLAKKNVDTTAIMNWPALLNAVNITNDGKYMGYWYSKFGQYSKESAEFVFKSIDGKWVSKPLEKPIPKSLRFSENSCFAVILTLDNNMVIRKLGQDKLFVIPGVARFDLLNYNKKNFVIFRDVRELEVGIYELESENFVKLDGILEYKIDDLSNKIIALVKNGKDFALKTFSPSNTEGITVYQSVDSLENLIKNPNGSKFIFNNINDKFFIYNNKHLFPLKIDLPQNCSGLFLSKIVRFDGIDNQENLVIDLETKSDASKIQSKDGLKIFSYQDRSKFADRLVETPNRRSYLAVYNLKKKSLIRVEFFNQKLRSLSKNGLYALVLNDDSNADEYYWNATAQLNGYVINLETSKKTNIKGNEQNAQLSPNGQHVIFTADRGGDLLCLNSTSGEIRNITKSLPIPLHDPLIGEPQYNKSRGLKIVGWRDDSKSVIIYDRYDIWQCYIDGSRARNLTNGIGRQRQIMFRLIDDKLSLRAQEGEEICLAAFNNKTMDNGFFYMKFGMRDAMCEMTMGPYLYYFPGPMSNVNNFTTPVKARDKRVWVVSRQSAEESPNLYWTNDFKVMNPLTDIHPENKYNWLTSELIDFKTKEGVKTQALLYKPQDFDPSKKYPVLFSYYQTDMSPKFHQYRPPAYTDGYVYNYPLMLAQGYLICSTDINQKPGFTAKSIVDAVEGAADELSKRKYVDNKHFGIMGGSFGGYATNCLATMSHKFAAAVSIAGQSNLLSNYANMPGLSIEHIENRQMGMDISLATDPFRYLDNSPIAHVKQSSTPLLIAFGAQDRNVNPQQGIDMFTVLRREGKLAWMLWYEKDNHGIHDKENQKDLFKRISQFFDHYLKNAPAPLWMTREINADKINSKDGFEYDGEIKTPKASLLLNGSNNN